MPARYWSDCRGPRGESEAARCRRRHPQSLPEDSERAQDRDRGSRRPDRRAARELEEGRGTNREVAGVVNCRDTFLITIHNQSGVTQGVDSDPHASPSDRTENEEVMKYPQLK
jgi:hypothetical protein